MPATAPHARRAPLNLSADDLRACAARDARPLRDVIDDLRSDYNADRLKFKESVEWLERNPYARVEAPNTIRQRLARTADLLFHLLRLYAGEQAYRDREDI